MENESVNFIESIINEDLANGKHSGIVTRFPPEPNGYLHVGHSKSLCINFGIKEKYHGECNLRYDDTNPTKEDIEYVDAIKRDIKWLGFEWDRELYASDYFEKMYEHAVELIKDGKAFVCDMSAEEISASRGTLTEPGKESPSRYRSIAENLWLFEAMRDGNFADGAKVLRAKIDMKSPNINMRDPVIYRVLRATHHRTGDKWCIYPMYDFAHPISDAIEGITHSICTLEFEDHRPLYDWVKINCGYNPGPRQIEFARLNLTRTIMSKRYLKKLVEEGVVEGWDDPRMPTISGMRERGYPPAAIRDFCGRIGVAKSNSEVDAALLEHCVREYLNERALRAMVVKTPVKLIIDNYEGSEELDIENNPMNPEAGTHKISFSNTIYIDSEDFNENPPPKYFRLKPDGMVRLKGAYIIKYVSHGLDEKGGLEVHCTLLEDSKSGGANANIKVKGTIHWVDAKSAVDVTINEFDYLLDDINDGRDFSQRINKNSKKVVTGAKAEAALKDTKPYMHYQFMRCGYYMTAASSTADNIAFNMVVGLKDSYKPE
ncbi:MAG: glutamine--tRNA ligase/YqeY domain fusion protein [Clostridia bacterium]|nr:glutamine--tRNA ligase/YqeY domain fusion protein [Clostridia bacterium]